MKICAHFFITLFAQGLTLVKEKIWETQVEVFLPSICLKFVDLLKTNTIPMDLYRDIRPLLLENFQQTDDRAAAQNGRKMVNLLTVLEGACCSPYSMVDLIESDKAVRTMIQEDQTLGIVYNLIILLHEEHRSLETTARFHGLKITQLHSQLRIDDPTFITHMREVEEGVYDISFKVKGGRGHNIVYMKAADGRGVLWDPNAGGWLLRSDVQDHEAKILALLTEYPETQNLHIYKMEKE